MTQHTKYALLGYGSGIVIRDFNVLVIGMNNQPNSVECRDCGTPIDTSGDTEVHCVPCSRCGSTKRHFHLSIKEEVIRRDGLEKKTKRAGAKKPFVEDRSTPSYSRRFGKLVNHQRLIDRDNDLYRETVTDYESGRIIHHCEEPLSQHRGHGSAKTRK